MSLQTGTEEATEIDEVATTHEAGGLTPGATYIVQVYAVLSGVRSDEDVSNDGQLSHIKPSR